jgi:hypothetical protein
VIYVGVTGDTKHVDLHWEALSLRKSLIPILTFPRYSVGRSVCLSRKRASRAVGPVLVLVQMLVFHDDIRRIVSSRHALAPHMRRRCLTEVRARHHIASTCVCRFFLIVITLYRFHALPPSQGRGCHSHVPQRSSLLLLRNINSFEA